MSAPDERWRRAQRPLYQLARVLLVGLGVWLVFAALARLPHTLAILVSSFFIAYLLNPLLSLMERRGLNRTLAVSLVLGGWVLVFLAILALVAPLVVADVREMADRLPPRLQAAAEAAPAWVERNLGFSLPADLSATFRNLADRTQEALPQLAQNAGRIFAGFASGALDFLVLLADAALIPLLAFYFMRDFGPLTRRLSVEVVPLRFRTKAADRVALVDDALGGFVRGQLVVCSILAVLYTGGLLLSSVPLAFVIGPLAGLANIIPFMGGVVLVGLSVIVAALEGQGWGPFVGIGVTLVLVQTLESFVLTPRIVGGRVGLSPAAVIVALAAFGELFGFVGALLAIPAAAVLRVLLPDLRRAWRNTRFFTGEL